MLIIITNGDGLARYYITLTLLFLLQYIHPSIYNSCLACPPKDLPDRIFFTSHLLYVRTLFSSHVYVNNIWM